MNLSDAVLRTAERDMQALFDERTVTCQLWDIAPGQRRSWWQRLLTRHIPRLFPPPPRVRPVSERRPINEDIRVVVGQTLSRPWVNFYDANGVVLAWVTVDMIMREGESVHPGRLTIQLSED